MTQVQVLGSILMDRPTCWGGGCWEGGCWVGVWARWGWGWGGVRPRGRGSSADISGPAGQQAAASGAGGASLGPKARQHKDIYLVVDVTLCVCVWLNKRMYIKSVVQLKLVYTKELMGFTSSPTEVQDLVGQCLFSDITVFVAFYWRLQHCAVPAVSSSVIY